MGEDSARALRTRLEHGQASPGAVVDQLALAAVDAATRTARLDACRLLGDLAGRALGADWDAAERAAFALLEAARVADTAADRRGVVAAMGRGFRNIWLLPFVHRRISDRDPTIAVAALQAAGGLGFPALEEAVASFVSDSAPPALRRAAIAALGRMGAMSAAERLVPYVSGDPIEAAAALTALTEIRSPVAREAAIAIVDGDLEPELQIAAVRYLAELGALEVLPVLRRLARHEDAETRLAANMASRALKAERNRDAGERFLVALSESDRAVRAVLARRLRTLGVAEVVEQAEILLGEDAAGVVQILGELREPEVTRYLLELAERPALDPIVRARAIGSIEADQSWERDALAKVAHKATADVATRAAAVQAMGAFAQSNELIDRIGDLASSAEPAIRGAVLWALQLARRTHGDATAIARIVAPLLDDADLGVRRRASYVAGNLGLDELAPQLAKLVAATSPPDLRLACYVALGELRVVPADMIAAMRREDDPRVLGAASNALLAAAPDAAALASLSGRASQLLTLADPREREAGAEIAGLLAGAVPPSSLVALARDDSPAVRGAAIGALGRLTAFGDATTEAALLAAIRDDDPAVRERAAAGLVRLATPDALALALGFIAGDSDPTTRGELAAAITVQRSHAEQLAPAIDAALARLGGDDPAFEPLVRLKLATLPHGDSAPALDVDAEIIGAFPAFAQLVKLAGFAEIVKSLRTAESLFQSTPTDADLSPPITLWMKVLENYVHAWLGPRMAGLQREPATLFEYVDRVIGASWPGFQRWLEPKWKDPIEVGSAKVDIPLRSIPNAVRELTEHRRKRLDSPLSITEWARLMVLFAVDHPSSGFRNLMKLGGKSADKTVALAHRLHTLAAVRNLVTHRASAGAATVTAFRRGYYAAFEDLVALA